MIREGRDIVGSMDFQHPRVLSTAVQRARRYPTRGEGISVKNEQNTNFPKPPKQSRQTIVACAEMQVDSAGKKQYQP